MTRRYRAVRLAMERVKGLKIQSIAGTKLCCHLLSEDIDLARSSLQCDDQVTNLWRRTSAIYHRTDRSWQQVQTIPLTR